MNQQKAILYIRVSTDEQAEKGYSLKHQEERLRQYCQHQQIEVVAVYKEDHSAKTFERPEFTKLLAFLKKNKGCADLLLFLKWDRFSRNAGDAYAMINLLNKLGVEPQGIEQPLDLNVPENKIMLAFYLAAPEVENDRRSLNTIAGMRRAMKEGRHVTLAPRGYRNARNELNRPIIEPNKDADHVSWSFQQVSAGIHTVMDCWKAVVKRGFCISKNQFWNMLRNPIYCGKIYIPAYKDEPETTIPATHEALISEALFYDVQDVLNGRKRKFPSKNTLKAELPLRGFLECCKCGGRLTGSASRGNGGRYFYYHCAKGCNERFKAEIANDLFVKELERISFSRGGIKVFRKVLMDYSKRTGQHQSVSRQQIDTEIEKNQQRIQNAQQLMLDSQLEPADYREMKSRFDRIIMDLEKKKRELSSLDFNLNEYITSTIDIVENLPKYFTNADLKAKQQLIGSICPEKLIFENNSYRTKRVNEVLTLICSADKAFSGSKKKLAPVFGSQSNQVPRTGIEPARSCERQILSLLRLPIPPPGPFSPEYSSGAQYYINHLTCPKYDLNIFSCSSTLSTSSAHPPGFPVHHSCSATVLSLPIVAIHTLLLLQLWLLHLPPSCFH